MDFSRYEQLQVTRDGTVVTVTLNRPEVKTRSARSCTTS